MPSNSLELADQVMDALGQRDLRRLNALTDPEVEWHSFFAVLSEGGVYRGHDGTRTFLSDLDEAFEIARADVDDGLAVGAIALLVGRLHYRGKGSGVEAETPVGWMLKFRDGKLLWFRAFRDPEPALEAVVLQE